MNFLEKRLSTSEIKEIHEGVSFFDEFINSVININEFNLLAYSNLGRSFSALLANYGLVQVYRKFVTEYNQTIKNEFFQDNQTINEIAMLTGIPGLLLRDSFYQKDVTDLFSKNSFKKESNLEQILYKSLANWSDEWIVKRQQRVGSGISDLTIELEEEKTAIELKKGTAISKDVLQASGYCTRDSGFNSILIANRIDPEALNLAQELNVSCYQYCLTYPAHGEVPDSFLLERVSDDSRKTNIQHMLSDINVCGGHIISFFEKKDSIEEFDKSGKQNISLIHTLISILENPSIIALQK